MCCGNKALTVFAYHVLTDVSGARDVNNIRSSQMRLLPLLLIERIRNWLNLFLKHCSQGGMGKLCRFSHSSSSLNFSREPCLFNTQILFSLINIYPFSIPMFPPFPCPVAPVFSYTFPSTLSSSLLLLVILSLSMSVSLPS